MTSNENGQFQKKHDFLIRHSTFDILWSFVIRHWSFLSAESGWPTVEKLRRVGMRSLALSLALWTGLAAAALAEVTPWGMPASSNQASDAVPIRLGRPVPISSSLDDGAVGGQAPFSAPSRRKAESGRPAGLPVPSLEM
jgi:hypothetical protein